MSVTTGAMPCVHCSGRTFVAGEGESFTHAVLVRRYREEDERHALSYQPTEQDRLDFEWFSHVARQVPGSFVHGWGHIPFAEFTSEKVASAKAKIAGGWDGYVRARQAEEERRFRLKVATGYYEPFVFAWAGSEEQAEAAYARAEAEGFEPLCIKEVGRH